jgi:signal transduction protein with GAF and PtsI domain
MTEGTGEEVRVALSQAQDAIRKQAAEIEALRARLCDEQFMKDLSRGVLRAQASGGFTSSPFEDSHLLELVVESAAQVTSATAASLLLIDEGKQDLVFTVALGPNAAAVKKLRVPLGHGIAGLVAATGQPMIVADAQRDLRSAADIAGAAGYFPKSILCVPLVSKDEVIGVLEMLDKKGSTGSFTPEDMDVLALFAKQAVAAIEQCSFSCSVTALLAASVKRAGAVTDEQTHDRAHDSVSNHEGALLHRRTLELVGLVEDMARRGECELDLCEKILRSIVEYLRAREESPTPGAVR